MSVPPLREEPRQPCYAACGRCGHRWIYAYVPMECGLFLQALKRAMCARCGATSKALLVYEPGRLPAALT